MKLGVSPGSIRSWSVLALLATFAAGRMPGQIPMKGTFEACDPDSTIVMPINVVGPPVAGLTVTIDASATKILFTDGACRKSLVTLVSSQVQWDLTARPPFSQTTLHGTEGKTPTLMLDVIGEYRVRFTGCPAGCRPLINKFVAPDSTEITIVAKDIIPPESVPTLP